MNRKRLQTVRELEEKLEYASPQEAARITKELVKIKSRIF